jgi:hypothetical protein
MSSSSAAAKINRTLTEITPGTLRHTVLSAAKRFKTTWVELGKLLVSVRDEAKYEEWGYRSFETYCSRELHIRRATALKLTRSFSFLAKHEPRIRDTDEEAVSLAPAFEVVEVLADAEERGQLSNQEYKAIRDSIWNPEQPMTQLRRELNERFPRPAPTPPADELVMRRLAAAARKLAEDLSRQSRVPKAVAERAAALAEDVEEIATRMKPDEAEVKE